jgi:hypothetical protein
VINVIGVSNVVFNLVILTAVQISLHTGVSNAAYLIIPTYTNGITFVDVFNIYITVTIPDIIHRSVFGRCPEFL